MGLGDLQVGEQRRDGFGRHRRAAVGVHHPRDAVDGEDLLHHLSRQDGGLVGVHVRAHDVPGVDVDHHVRVEVRALDRPGELGDVPAEHLPGSGGDQLRDRPRRVAGQAATLLDLLVLRQDPVDRGDRAQIHALVQELGVDLDRGQVHEPGRVHDPQHPGPLDVGQLVHRHPGPVQRRGAGLAGRGRPRYPDQHRRGPGPDAYAGQLGVDGHQCVVCSESSCELLVSPSKSALICG